MSSQLSAGTRLGRYEIHSQIGAGGMGEVYRAYDPKMNREIAIKILPAAFSADKERLARFEQEAQAAREAFITSATNFVMPVVRIDGKPIGNGAPGLLSLKLRAEFHTAAEHAER